MPIDLGIYDIEPVIRRIQRMARKRNDGLKFFRLIGPDLDPTFNDQVGVAECQKVEQLVCESNRGGKSLVVAAKIAAMARDVPLTTWDGRKINCRLPHHDGLPLVIWGIGYQLNHVGETMFRLLFEEGQFDLIRDPDTEALRPFMPWQKWDAEHKDETLPAPPLIPPHVIDQKSWVWENKGAHQVVSVRLINGTTFKFYPSTGEPKKGDPVHCIWIDEKIQYSESYAEWVMRLTDYEGCLLWATMLYPSIPAIARVMDRAELQEDELRRGDRTPERVITKVFHFKQTGNPYLGKRRIEINREILESEGDDEVAMRIDGGNPVDRTLIYPFFSKKVHCAIPEDESEWDDLAKVLSALGGMPPDDWCHTMIIDPGAQKPGVLFTAVPPRVWKWRGKSWDLWADATHPFHVPYAEIYGQRYKLGELVKRISELMDRDGKRVKFRRFIMDMQGGRISSMTGGAPAHRVFSDAFAEERIESAETGVNFMAGGTDFTGRRQIVARWMEVLQCGKPTLRIVVQNCPNLCWQLERNQFQLQGEQVTEKEARRERNDLRQCLEYDASRSPKGPKFVEVEQEHHPLPRWVNRMEAMEERMGLRKREEQGRCHFGPGRAP